MYDEEALVRVCNEMGIPAKAAQPFESAIPDIRVIELEMRVGEAVIIEAIKA
jgi:hypothetical protein